MRCLVAGRAGEATSTIDAQGPRLICSGYVTKPWSSRRYRLRRGRQISTGPDCPSQTDKNLALAGQRGRRSSPSFSPNWLPHSSAETRVRLRRTLEANVASNTSNIHSGSQVIGSQTAGVTAREEVVAILASGILTLLLEGHVPGPPAPPAPPVPPVPSRRRRRNSKIRNSHGSH